MTGHTATTGRPTFLPRDTAIGMYLALASAGFRRFSSYRQATAASAFTNAVFGFLRCYVLLAVVANTGGSAAGYDRTQLATLVWVGQGMIGTIGLWGLVEFADRIRSGDVVADLLRPVDIVAQQLATDLGRAGFAVTTRFVAPMVVGALVFDLYTPRRWVTYPIFALSVLLAVVVCFACRFVVNASTYWLLDSRGPQLGWLALSSVGSGLYFPLRFLPPALATTLYLATPLPSLIQVPVDLLTERVTGAGAAVLLLVQAGWAAAMLWVCRLVQRRGERRLVVQGG